MLKVNINQLTFDCIIGILDFERQNKQTVVVDISFEYFFDQQNNNFIDYSKVALIVQKTMIDKKYKLLEDAIINLREILKATYNIKNLHLKITKPNIIDNCIVSIEE